MDPGPATFSPNWAHVHFLSVPDWLFSLSSPALFKITMCSCFSAADYSYFGLKGGISCFWKEPSFGEGRQFPISLASPMTNETTMFKTKFNTGDTRIIPYTSSESSSWYGEKHQEGTSGKGAENFSFNVRFHLQNHEVRSFSPLASGSPVPLPAFVVRGHHISAYYHWP